MFRHLQLLFRQNSYFFTAFALGIGFSIIMGSVFDQRECGNFSVELENINQRKSVEGNDLYEPKINLAAKPKSALKSNNGMIRPRFHKAELGIKRKLFVGILTCPESITTLAVALNKTLSKFVSKIMFFIDAPSAQRLNVSMLKLPGIVGFTDTRKVLKPFHLLKYIGDNFLEDYDFFFISKDTSYIQPQKLVNYVKKISVKHDVHVGKKVQNDDICSLDFGILLSNSVATKVHKSLEWCVKNYASEDDSANIEQCIVFASKVPCTDISQGSKFHTYNVKPDQLIPTSTEGIQKFKKAIVVAPLSDANQYYRIHFFYFLLSAEELNVDIERLRQSVMVTKANVTSTKLWPPASQPPATPLSHFDVLRWDHFNLSHKYLSNDFLNMAPLAGAEKEDIHKVVSKCVSYTEEKYNGALRFFSFVNGYQRFDPSRGMDYIVDLKFRETTSGKNVHKRLEVYKSLGKVEMVFVPYVTENVRVHLIIPVKSTDTNRILLFLKQYSINAMEKKDLQFLMLVFIYGSKESSKGEDDVFKEVKNKALVLSNKFEKVGNLIKWHSIKLPAIRSNKSLTDALLDFAILDSVLKKFPHESVILLGRPNMEVRLDYFNRVRMNTVLGFQIFSPIPFSEYHPKIVYNKNHPQAPELDINKNYGHYDSTNFQHISFYTVDYFKARRKIEGVVPVVKSDKDILKLLQRTSLQDSTNNLEIKMAVYNMFIRNSKLHVMRAVEPSLRLRHQSLEPCSQCKNLSLQENDYCSSSEAFNLATRSQLGRLILDYQVDSKDLSL